MAWKEKGEITLHDIGDEFVDSDALEKWELILDVLKSGEMPPEEEKQRPSAKETEQVTGWIEKRLKDAITSHTKKEKQPLARRLSNFEYENTIRDLIGFHLDLNDNLPDDPRNLTVSTTQRNLCYLVRNRWTGTWKMPDK